MRQLSTTRLHRAVDLTLERSLLRFAEISGIEFPMNALQSLDIACVGVGLGGAREQAQSLIDASSFAASLSCLECVGGFQNQSSFPRAWLDTFGNSKEGFPERTMESAALFGVRGVSGGAFSKNRETLLLIPEGVRVLQTQTRGLRVLARILEQPGSLLQITCLLQSERCSKRSARGPSDVWGF